MESKREIDQAQESASEHQAPEPILHDWCNLMMLATICATMVPIPIADTSKQNIEEQPIGSGQTTVPKNKYPNIGTETYTKATGILLRAVFSREVLGTHSLTGKQSPAFPDKPARPPLDAQKVNDIVLEISYKYTIPEKVVRNVITTKCADENKMLKKSMAAKQPEDAE